jgi:hypothetical protein
MWNSELRASELSQLHALNRDYVEHLLNQPIAPEENFPPSFLPELNRLETVARLELCANPYTLYHLPFNNVTYWQEMLALSRQGVQSMRAIQLRGTPAHRVTELVLFMSWHLARTTPGAARLFFGMSIATLEFFRHAEVAALAIMSNEVASALQPRWPANPHFWPDLIHYADKDPVRMQAARLLGAQLLASELRNEDEHALQLVRERSESAARQRRSSKRTSAVTLPAQPTILSPQ